VAICIVYDNYAYDPELQAAWGFACVIQGYEKTILFDTGGNGRKLLSNMNKVGIDPRDIDVVVLSHNHGDHTGGLGDFLSRNANVTVFAPASFPKRFTDGVRRAGAEVVAISKPQAICKGVSSVGEMGRWIREQSLCLGTREGLVVITGCAHPGIVAIAEKAKELHGMPLHLVMGGFHLFGPFGRQLRSVADGLKEAGVRNVAPCHCSGNRARRMMKEIFGDHYLPSGVGTYIGPNSAG